MSKMLTQTFDRIESWWIQLALVVGASFFVALCAHLTLPLPFTPVPLTLQNFGVLLVALALGSKRGFAALALYLLEGVSGMPVFNPAGAGGLVQLLGPTGGYLLAYPVVAFVVGLIAERGARNFARYALAALAGASSIVAAPAFGALTTTRESAGASARTACLICRMCSGVVPQQPPTSFTPFRMKRRA